MGEHIYHLAIESEWLAAVGVGDYRRSTRGLSLDEVGFVHCSADHQVRPTAERFYADLGQPLLLLTIDPDRLDAPVVHEPGGDEDELFPHVYGPIPVHAVVAIEPFEVASP